VCPLFSVSASCSSISSLSLRYKAHGRGASPKFLCAYLGIFKTITSRATESRQSCGRAPVRRRGHLGAVDPGNSRVDRKEIAGPGACFPCSVFGHRDRLDEECRMTQKRTTDTAKIFGPLKRNPIRRGGIFHSPERLDARYRPVSSSEARRRLRRLSHMGRSRSAALRCG